MKILQALTLALALVASAAMAGDVAGVIGWSQRVELGMLVSGVVEKVHVRPGQSVARGDSLVSLDGRRFKSEVARTLAGHRHAQALLEEAQREDERAIELYDRTVLSDFERNQALIALKGAQAHAQAARAAWLQARLDLERSVIRSPFDGVILAVDVAPGQTVVSDLQSSPMVTVADKALYLARAQVDIDQASRLATADVVRATVRGQDFEARIRHVGFEPVSQSGQGPRYELVAEVRAPEGQNLRAGETVILHLE